MAEEQKKPQPIIKKIKKVAGGHHGGAWKIAYADFVTAMMAFFLLLWLLSTTPSKTLQGIADYFAPTIGIKDEKGIGFYGGKVPLDEGQSSSDSGNNPAITYGVPKTGPKVDDPVKPTESKEDEAEAAVEEAKFKGLEEEIKKAIESSEELSAFMDNIVVTITNEGLKIEVIDQDKVSMFKIGSSELEAHAKKLLQKIAEVIKGVPNFISISGHTDSTPYASDRGYGNWELSSDRANSTRRFIETVGVRKEKIARVVGRAEKEPRLPENPTSALNRRISIILLYKSIMPYQEKAAPEGLFENKDVDSKLLSVKPEERKLKIEPKKVEEPKKQIKANEVQDPFSGTSDSSGPSMNLP